MPQANFTSGLGAEIGLLVRRRGQSVFPHEGVHLRTLYSNFFSGFGHITAAASQCFSQETAFELLCQRVSRPVFELLELLPVPGKLSRGRELRCLADLGR